MSYFWLFRQYCGRYSRFDRNKIEPIIRHQWERVRGEEMRVRSKQTAKRMERENKKAAKNALKN